MLFLSSYSVSHLPSHNIPHPTGPKKREKGERRKEQVLQLPFFLDDTVTYMDISLVMYETNIQVPVLTSTLVLGINYFVIITRPTI